MVETFGALPPCGPAGALKLNGSASIVVEYCSFFSAAPTDSRVTSPWMLLSASTKAIAEM